ncbi:MAG: alpha/beta hydrolase [Pseudomonadota bacterium]
MTESSRHLLDPELLPLVDNLPPFSVNDDNLDAMRGREVVTGDPGSRGVSRDEVTFSSADGTEISALLYTPEAGAGPRPGYLHIHGGGYVMGSALGSDINNINVVSKLGAVVLSVDYRLAPETSIPGPLEDCYAALAWLFGNADHLQIDTTRIGIGGESAGGGLAAALAILARDRGEYPLCHQHLTYPMLDDTTGSPENPGDPLVGEFVWTRASNKYGWESYLGDAEPVAPQVPARLEDFSGLPHTWLSTATLDLFRDENITYAKELMRAGIVTDLIVYPGACHGFQMLPGTRVQKRYARDHLYGLAEGLGVELES